MGIVETPIITYLVDLENIGTKFLFQHIEEHEKASYMIFYSDATSAPGIILEHISQDAAVTFVDCKTGGNNAMDFCICAAAGRLSTKNRILLRILSDDKGYDPMIQMLNESGVRISRELTGQNAASKKSNAKPSSADETPLIKAIKTNVAKQYQNQLIAVLPGAIDRKEAHELIQAIVPKKMVSATYKQLKKHIPKVGA